MEENPLNDIKRGKNTFKDILISANNDDIVIPMSATFDKAVLHIGIGKRNGIIIEKPDVKHGEEVITSAEYATRKFTEYYYEGKKKENDTDSKNEDKKKPVVEPGEKISRRDMEDGKKIDRCLPQSPSSVDSEAHLEMKKIKETMFEAGFVRKSNPESVKSDADIIKATLGPLSTHKVKCVSLAEPHHKQTITERHKQGIVAECQVDTKTNMDTDIALQRSDKTRFNTVKAIPVDKLVFGTIDEAYQNEMLEIAVEREARVPHPNEKWPPNNAESCLAFADFTYLDGIFMMSNRGSKMFADYETSSKNEMNISETLLHYPLEKYVLIARQNERTLVDTDNDISEVVIVDADQYKSGISDTLVLPSDVTPVEAITQVIREPHNDPLDALSDSCTLETVVDIHSDKAILNSDLLNTKMDIQPDDMVSDSDLPAAVVDTDSDDELSDSDTLDEIEDIELDDVDLESDDDIIDIESIALLDQDEVDITAALNDNIDNMSTDEGDVFEDDDNLFGIMKIYVKSDLHYDLNKMPLADHDAEKKDIGYQFFCFSTFYK